MKQLWKDMIENAEELVKLSGIYLKKYPQDKDWQRIHANNKKHLANVKASSTYWINHYKNHVKD